MTTRSLLLALSLAACAGGKASDPQPGPAGPMGDPGAMGAMGTAGANGQACWDLNGNATCDPNTEDQNDDGVCDVGDCIGPAGPAGAVGPAGTTGQVGASAFSTAALTVVGTTTTFAVIPGMTATITVPATSVVMMSTDGGIATTSTATTGFSSVDIALAVDGVLLANGGYHRVIAANTTGLTAMLAPWSMSALATLPAGAHTISVMAAGTAQGADATVAGNNTSVNQGTLSVVVLKL